MASPALAFLVHAGPLHALAFLSRLPAEGAALLLGGGGALGAEAAQLVGLATLALLLFYLVSLLPLALIVLAVAAVVITAVWLGIYSGP